MRVMQRDVHVFVVKVVFVTAFIVVVAVCVFIVDQEFYDLVVCIVSAHAFLVRTCVQHLIRDKVWFFCEALAKDEAG